MIIKISTFKFQFPIFNQKLSCMKKILVSAFSFLAPFIIFSQQNISALIEQKAMAVQSKLVEWRRYLHQHPELSNREYKTGEFVAAHLRALGLEVKYPVARTGVVAILKGARPGP